MSDEQPVGWDEWLDTLPSTMQKNIKDSLTRGESFTFLAYQSGASAERKRLEQELLEKDRTIEALRTCLRSYQKDVQEPAADIVESSMNASGATQRLAELEQELQKKSLDAARWNWARWGLMSMSFVSGPYSSNVESHCPVFDDNTGSYWDKVADRGIATMADYSSPARCIPSPLTPETILPPEQLVEVQNLSIENELLRAVHEAGRSLLRNYGVDPDATNKAMDDLRITTERVKEFYSGTMSQYKLADHVEWVVNDNAELGVRVAGVCFFLYKGDSMIYPNGLHDDGRPMYVRLVGKCEFGETCWPVKMITDGQRREYNPEDPADGLFVWDTVDGDYRIVNAPKGGWAKVTPLDSNTFFTD